MFICSFKLTKTKAVLFTTAVALLLCSLIFLKGAGAQPTFKNAAPSTKNIKTTEDIVKYLKGYGWEVNPEPAEFSEIEIPNEFGQVLEKYNILQREGGFDLEKYKGKRLKRYTFEVLNYPGNTENVRANVFLYGDKIVGGDVCSTDENGFMHGFENK